jgi:hypothetical protein
MPSYSEKLRDPRWQRRRLEKLSAHDFSCEACGDSDNTLHVHHRIYRRGLDPWEYKDDELAVLCEHCHELEHWCKSTMLESVLRIPPIFPVWSSITLFVAGLCMSTPPVSQRNATDDDFFIDIARKLSDEGEKDAVFLSGFMAGYGLPGQDPLHVVANTSIRLP